MSNTTDLEEPTPASGEPNEPITALAKTGYTGTEKLLWGIVLAVVTFWLFAGTAGSVAPEIMNEINAGQTSPLIDASSMNLAVSITALFSGLFIVFFGGLADRFGRVRLALIGIVLGIIGSALLVFATGPAALALLLAGRAIQGLSAACVMPSTMALVKSYWDGPARQRAVSMWSIGSWGGSGLSAVFGGTVVQFVGWRGIFVASIVISVIAFFMILGTPEDKAATQTKHRFDVIGLLLFVVGTLGLMIVLLFGSSLGWLSIPVITSAVIAVIAYVIFVVWERRQANPFIDFTLFSNTTFTGATISNFLLNGTIGMLMVSQQLIQLAAQKPDGTNYTAFEAGLLTIGYAVFIIAFIRVGERLLQRFGPRKPMLWGTLIVSVAAILLMATNLLVSQYFVLAVIAYCLFGLGLAFYATPSTDAALSNLPADQSGAGSGIYKMASSLGSAIGAAVSLAVFSGLAGGGASVLGNVIQMEGRTDNVSLRLAGMMGIGVSLVFCLLALVSIVTTVPKGGGSRELGKSAESPAPEPHATLDEEKQSILDRLADLPLDELRQLEKQHLVNELADLPPEVLKDIVAKRHD
ncbi:MFS transporter [Gulosibacter molinativorax]|uniref:MFS transporter n=1 Tax=Gulosibacter molinativorax TaxID=256821 RepID=A0ABT7C890_9MICO|nr:MFS transporter [Gulosibacter molinativorax]MDJ1370876.1 MFS transporter [Gulosibacter molinativorax]QUY62213.1 Quinolone resistance protein NorB [Gulosibacter molinativorax]